MKYSWKKFTNENENDVTLQASYNASVDKHVDSIKQQIISKKAPIIPEDKPIVLDEFTISVVPKKTCCLFETQKSADDLWLEFAKDVLKKLNRDHEVLQHLTQDCEIKLTILRGEGHSEEAKGMVTIEKKLIEISLDDSPKKTCSII